MENTFSRWLESHELSKYIEVLLDNDIDSIELAIDIRSKFAKEKDSRNSGNVEDWIHTIEDEDDRDQVLLWAKQVAKGKITDADFSEKIKPFI